MLFDAYKHTPESQVNPALLWEYDLSVFDYSKMRNLVVQRVVERGWPKDWFAILNLYGEKGVIEAIKSLPYLNEKDTRFVCAVFQIPIEQLKCYTKKQSHQPHWNS
jgi:hypothetical protein